MDWPEQEASLRPLGIIWDPNCLQERLGLTQALSESGGTSEGMLRPSKMV